MLGIVKTHRTPKGNPMIIRDVALAYLLRKAARAPFPAFRLYWLKRAEAYILANLADAA